MALLSAHRVLLSISTIPTLVHPRPSALLLQSLCPVLTLDTSLLRLQLATLQYKDLLKSLPSLLASYFSADKILTIACGVAPPHPGSLPSGPSGSSSGNFRPTVASPWDDWPGLLPLP